MSDETTTTNPWVTGAEPVGLTYCLYAAFAGDRGDRRLESGERAAAAAEALAVIDGVDGVLPQRPRSLAHALLEQHRRAPRSRVQQGPRSGLLRR